MHEPVKYLVDVSHGVTKSIMVIDGSETTIYMSHPDNSVMRQVMAPSVMTEPRKIEIGNITDSVVLDILAEKTIDEILLDHPGIIVNGIKDP